MSFWRAVACGPRKQWLTRSAVIQLPSIDLVLQRSGYYAVVGNPDGAFLTERPPLFSPAAAVQDQANGKGALQQWAAMFPPQEYTNWLDESQAHVRTCYLGDWSALAKLEAVPTAVRVGDVLGPRTLEEATLEGTLASFRLHAEALLRPDCDANVSELRA
jgi:hypothetical protein